MFSRDLAIVDVETTGDSARYGRIIEVGILKVREGELVEVYSSLVNPETPVPYFIEGLTGIRNRDLRNAPTFGAIKDELHRLLDGSVFVAHNARFDYSFIREEFKRVGITYQASCLCTMGLSKALFPEYRRHSLDSILERFGFACANRHRALGDARVLWDFLRTVERDFPSDDIRAALDKLMKAPVMPLNVDDAKIKALPETHGVYIFYGDEGHPLYVGKSANIRNRVLSHFANRHHSSKEKALCERVTDIAHTKTSGELGALLLESRLIKKMLPLYNRRSKRARRLVIARKNTDPRGFYSVSLEYLNRLSPDDFAGILGVFRHMKEAKEYLWERARIHSLCPKILGIEKGAGSCSFCQLERCKGACTSLEQESTHNLRFDIAFCKNAIYPWPFVGPIVIEEANGSQGKGEAYLVDKWCLLGCVGFDETGKRELYSSDYDFDFDSYKILLSYLERNRKKLHVKEITYGELESLLAR
jgi:DNA polymerase-3 subunit epsilon